MPKRKRIAVDFSVLIDLAEGSHKSLLPAIVDFAKQLDAQVVVSQVSTQDLAYAAVSASYDENVRSLATTALRRIEAKWGFVSMDLEPTELGICVENVRQFVARGIVTQSNEVLAHTLAEAVALECKVLLTHEPELLSVPRATLKRVLAECGRDDGIQICSASELIRR